MIRSMSGVASWPSSSVTTCGPVTSAADAGASARSGARSQAECPDDPPSDGPDQLEDELAARRSDPLHVVDHDEQRRRRLHHPLDDVEQTCTSDDRLGHDLGRAVDHRLGDEFVEFGPSRRPVEGRQQPDELGDRLVPVATGCRTGEIHHVAPVAVHRGGHLREQPGLADARQPAHAHHRRDTGAGVRGPRATETGGHGSQRPVELGVAPDQRSSGQVLQTGGQRRVFRPRPRGQPVAEHPLDDIVAAGRLVDVPLEIRHLDTGFHTELIGQSVPEAFRRAAAPPQAARRAGGPA